MASFIVMKSRGKNGRGGRNTLTQREFAGVVKMFEGDVTKISEHLGKPADSIVKRCNTLKEKNFILPKLHNIPAKKRTRVEMTPDKQVRLVKIWNQLEGDAEATAEKLGVSVATVMNWVGKIEDKCFEINMEKLMLMDENLTAEEAEAKLNEEGFRSVFCERKAGTGKRGRAATPLDGNLVSLLNDEIEDSIIAEEESKEEEPTVQEKIEADLGVALEEI